MTSRLTPRSSFLMKSPAATGSGCSFKTSVYSELTSAWGLPVMSIPALARSCLRSVEPSKMSSNAFFPRPDRNAETQLLTSGLIRRARQNLSRIG